MFAKFLKELPPDPRIRADNLKAKGHEIDLEEIEQLRSPINDVGLDPVISNLLIAYHLETVSDVLIASSFNLLTPESKYQMKPILSKRMNAEVQSVCRIYAPVSAWIQKDGAERYVRLYEACTKTNRENMMALPIETVCREARIPDSFRNILKAYHITELSDFIRLIAENKLSLYQSIDALSTVKLLRYCETYLKLKGENQS